MGGRRAANVVGLWSRTRDAARLHRAYGMRSHHIVTAHPNPTLDAERQAGRNGFHFYSLWYDPAGDRTSASRFQGRRSNHKATELVRYYSIRVPFGQSVFFFFVFFGKITKTKKRLFWPIIPFIQHWATRQMLAIWINALLESNSSTFLTILFSVFFGATQTRAARGSAGADWPSGVQGRSVLGPFGGFWGPKNAPKCPCGL